MSDIPWCDSEACFIMNKHRHVEKNVIEFAHIKADYDKGVVTSFNVQLSDEGLKVLKDPDNK